MQQPEKDLVWLRGKVKTPPFSKEARVEAGVLLRRLQRGEKLSMPQSRPMPSIGSGCHELRIRDESRVWRIFYFIDADAIVLLDVIDKKTRRTSQGVMEESRKRLAAYKAAR
ncbi:MAG TPA: type II toxin-antitoxin system RelE/ParE family toxin [Candidatus Eisenbacteria bacterium]|nr:type II toxin-antitoxin system RelE/ParE family toxin [Candidatus Eisenbacteria bacterium]